MIINNKNKGNILAEMLIGLALSMVTLLSVTVISAEFDNQKKSNSANDDSVKEATNVLQSLKQDITNSYYRFNDQHALFGCQMQGSYNGNSFSTPLFPVMITTASDYDPTNKNTNSDSLTTVFGSYSIGNGSTKTSTAINPFDPNDSNRKAVVSSDISFFNGDIVLTAPATVSFPATFAADSTVPMYSNINLSKSGNKATACTVSQVSSIDRTTHTISMNKSNLPFNSANLNYTYGAGSYFVNLGPSLNLINYQIVNDSNLVRKDLITNKSYFLSNNVVGLKFAYGIIDNRKASPPKVQWFDSSLINPATADASTLYPQLSNIVGVKVHIVIRSNHKQNSKACDTTNNSFFQSSTGLTNMNVDIKNLPDWQCYSYRDFETTIPLKNNFMVNGVN